MSNQSQQCPRCGATITAEAPQGLCPKCLLAAAALGTEPGEPTGPHGTKIFQSPPSLADVAAAFPQYEVLGLIGRGGMGVVYKARQKSLNRIVALKLLAPERVTDAHFAERFTREAQALARLSHPNIVTIHDFGIATAPQTPDAKPHSPFYFLLMEFVDGVNLRQAMKAGRFTPEQALAVVPPVCEALQYAHEHGIVHRDIKPENLLLDREGRVKIADFGIAKILEPGGAELPLGPDIGAAQQRSPTGSETLASAAGTPQYMAPEQKAHRVTDHRADIYSLGVVLYELLTGELPADKLQPPSRKVQIDVRLDEIVLRALEAKPERRYQTAGEFRTQVVTMTSENPKPAAAVPPAHWMGYEYKSKRTWFGLPLLHVVNRADPQTGKAIPARGIVAIGGVATGWLAMGGRAYGVIAFGGIAVGVIAFGGIAAGLVAFGGLAVALMLALGGLALAPTSVDGRAEHLPLWTDPHGNTFHWLSRSEWNGVIIAFWIMWLVFFGVFFFLSSWAKRQSFRALPTSGEPKPSAAIEPRFSRTAIVGACLVALGLLSVFLSFFVDRIATKPTTPEGVVLPNHPATSAAYAMIGAALLYAFFATLLGWIAVSQIRRSAGKICGLWLAVFDGLLFPLLALDAVIGLAWYSAFHGLWTVPPGFAGIDAGMWMLLTVVTLTSVSSCILDFLIIRRVWRAVNKPANSQSAVGTTPPPAVLPNSGWGWLIGKMFGITFTSRLAFQLANLSATGFFCFFGFVPLPGWKWLFGFSGFFGLIGVAMLMEMFHRARQAGPDAPRRPWLVIFTIFIVAVAAFVLAMVVDFAGLLAPHQSRQNTAEAQAQRFSPPAFGPVIERVVKDDLFSFATGLSEPLPSDLANVDREKNARRIIEWMRDHHADILKNGDDLAFVGMLLAPVEKWEAPWETFTPSALRTLMADSKSAQPINEMNPSVLRPQDVLLGTLAFQTRDGQAGLLQITGTATNPPGVKIRYKRVQSGATNAVATPATADAKLSFDPVIEREVDGPIDFDSGKVAELPEKVSESNDITDNILKAVAWLEREGMDAIPEPSHSLKGVGLKAKAMETNAWEQFSPEQTGAALADIQRELWQDLDPRHGDEPRKTPATWVFQTREGGKGILQVLEETEKGVKVRYKLLQSGAQAAASASKETWSPILAPGAMPDLQQIYTEAQKSRERGRYDEALQRHLWLHHRALEFDPSYSAVRLSFWLADWSELARRYPKAKQALIEIRDYKTRDLAAGRGHFDLFMDVKNINSYLQDDAATLALFKLIEKSDPQLAAQCAGVMESVRKNSAAPR